MFYENKVSPNLPPKSAQSHSLIKVNDHLEYLYKSKQKIKRPEALSSTISFWETKQKLLLKINKKQRLQQQKILEAKNPENHLKQIELTKQLSKLIGVKTTK